MTTGAISSITLENGTRGHHLFVLHVHNAVEPHARKTSCHVGEGEIWLWGKRQ